jgi:hypothetical protein
MTLRTVDFGDIGIVLSCSTSTAQRERIRARSCSDADEPPQGVVNASFIMGLVQRMQPQLTGMDC